MGILLEKLSEDRILVSDGTCGTLLQERGLKPGECPELWNIEHRDIILDIAKSYLMAGSDMIETNSFGGNRFKLQHYGLENRVHELNRAAAEISREACGKNKIVLGSIGPTGKILMTGEVTQEKLSETFSRQFIALAEGGADAIIIKTMSDLDEASLAIRAARENTGLDIICTMTFERTVNGEFRTMMGVSPSEMVKALKEAGADILGSNCGNGTGGMISVLKEIRKADPDIPVLIQGNAGAPEFKGGKTVYNETPEITAGFIPALVRGGANIIGGCCGTTPDHIARIKIELGSLKDKS